MKAVVMILAALAAVPLAAAVPMTNITVKITDQRGKAIERADVIVRFKNNRSVKKLGGKITTSWEMRTNMEGVAKILPIPQGTIQIQVIAKNYQTFGDDFDIYEDSKTVEIKLNAPQSQYTVK
jgi:hypothetical protein